jgi:aminoglycoside 2'-N-acetyltransferase I
MADEADMSVLLIQVVRTDDLPRDTLAAIRALMLAAFTGGFTDDDWDHALGGWHVVARDGSASPDDVDAVVAHAALVERTLGVGERLIPTGYVEGVATAPGRHGGGLGSAVMQRINQLVRANYEFGALATGRHTFYERVGWERWRGPTLVRRGDDLVRTPDDDDAVMVMRFGPTADVDLALPLSCDMRAGDVW